MTRKLLTKMKGFVFNKLAQGLSPYLQELQKEKQPLRATLSSTAKLGSESCIENLTGDCGRIVIDDNSFVRGRLLTYGHGGHIKIGKWCYVGLHSEIWSMDQIVIGDRVLISHHVNIHDGTAHSLNPQERHHHFKHILEKGHPTEPLPGVHSAPIIIEDDVWISFNVTILKGVRIGKGSVIAAGSIVTEDVPPGMLYKCRITPQLISLTEEK